MTQYIQGILKSLDAHPTGDISSWKARYEPLIATRRQFDPPPEKPVISVVIVAYRATDGLVECLKRVRGATLGASLEVIVVDNGGLQSIERSLGKWVNLHIKMKDNVGPSPARNAGFAWATGEIVAFLDDDGMIAPDYFTNALRYFDDPEVLGIRGKLVHRNHRYFTTLAGHYSRGEDVVKEYLITEGNCLVRAASFLGAGGFADRRYGHEGVELTYRLIQSFPKGKTLYAPDVVMAHDYVDGWQKFIKKETRYGVVDEQRGNQDSEELQRFMKAYFDTPYPGAKLSVDEKVAKVVLNKVRQNLKRVAKWRRLLSP